MLAMVAMALAFPAVMASAFIMTIDPPFLALWCWAAVWRVEGVGKATCSGPFPKKEGEEQKSKKTTARHQPRLPPLSFFGKGAGVRFAWWLLAAVCSAFGVMAEVPDGAAAVRRVRLPLFTAAREIECGPASGCSY